MAVLQQASQNLYLRANMVTSYILTMFKCLNIVKHFPYHTSYGVKTLVAS